MAEKTRFLIELASGEYGDRGMTNSPACVIEVKDRPDGGFKIIAPEYYRDFEVGKFFVSTFIECGGPARVVTSKERDDIIDSLIYGQG